MAIDLNTLIRKAKTLSNGVHGAVNVGQGLRNVPAEKHYSVGQMKAFAMQCTRIAEAVMGLPDDGRGNRAEANRVFASAGGALYDLAGNITGSAHQFSFEIADRPDRLIVIGINVLKRMASGKSAKAAAVVEAAKAVGAPRVKARPVSTALRSIIARDIVEIRASLQRGYINIKTARHLFGTLDNAYKSGVEAVKVAVDAASAILYYLSKVDGAQMLEPPEEMKGRIQQKLWVIVASIRESGS